MNHAEIASPTLLHLNIGMETNINLQKSQVITIDGGACGFRFECGPYQTNAHNFSPNLTVEEHYTFKDAKERRMCGGNQETGDDGDDRNRTGNN